MRAILLSLVTFANFVVSQPLTSDPASTFPAPQSTEASQTLTTPFTSSHSHSHLSHAFSHTPSGSHPFFNPAPTFSFPNPQNSPSSQHPPDVFTPPPTQHSQKASTVIIVFAVVGSVLGFILLVMFARFAISWKSIPRPSASMTPAARAQILREMDEYAAMASRRNPVVAPPPYEHAPSYESVTAENSP